MSEANADVSLDPDATKEPESVSEPPSELPAKAADDRLPTSRLPPIAPPPMRSPSIPSIPSASGVSIPKPVIPPLAPAPSLEEATRLRADAAGQAKPSWFRALLTTTSPPPALPTEDADALVLRRSVAIGCVVAACAFAAIALIFAFRAPPAAGTLPPVVAATTVIATALESIGAGALCYGLLRVAERFFSASPLQPEIEVDGEEYDSD